MKSLRRLSAPIISETGFIQRENNGLTRLSNLMCIKQAYRTTYVSKRTMPQLYICSFKKYSGFRPHLHCTFDPNREKRDQLEHLH